MRIVLAIAAAVINSMPLFAQPRSNAEAAIRHRVATLETAWNKRDAAALAALYAVDGDAIVMDSPLASGRPAIQAAVAADMAKQSPTLRIRITPASIRFLSPDIALVNTIARFNEGAVEEDRGTWIMVRRRGSWLIAALRVMPAERK